MSKGKKGDAGVNIGGNVTNSIITTGDGNVIIPPPQPTPDKLSLAAVVILICVVMFGMYGLILVLGKLLLIPPLTPPASPPVLPTETPVVVMTVTATEQRPVPSEARPTPSPSPEPVVFSPTSPADRMVAILQANRVEGKAPFEARFDGRASYVYFADGRLLKCSDVFSCSYSFSVYLNDKYVTSASNKTGLWQYTFGKKGEYKVGVYVCWNQVCGEDGVVVNVR